MDDPTAPDLHLLQNPRAGLEDVDLRRLDDPPVGHELHHVEEEDDLVEYPRVDYEDLHREQEEHGPAQRQCPLILEDDAQQVANYYLKK